MTLFKKSFVIFFLVGLIIGQGLIFIPHPVQAIDAVTVVNPSLPVQEIGKSLYDQLINTIKGTLTSVQTQISALKDMWEQARTILTDAMHGVTDQLLQQLINRDINDLMGWVQNNGDPLFIQDFQRHLNEQTIEKTHEIAQDLTLNQIKDPNLKQNAKTIIEEYQTEKTFESETATQLSDEGRKIGPDYFSWEGWANRLYPTNNFIGQTAIIESFLKTKENAARRAAEIEAVSPGFKGEKCDETGVKKGKCKNIGEIISPAAIAATAAEEVVFNDLRQKRAAQADLADNQGPQMPYITSLINSLVQRLIGQGFAFMSQTGPSSSQPNAPLPPPAGSEAKDIYSSWANFDLSSAEDLVKQQKLLKENLETQYLAQLQISLKTLGEIQDLQKKVLNALKNLYLGRTETMPLSRFLAGRCSLPSWAQVSENGNPVKIFTPAPAAVGAITFDKVSGAVFSYEYQSETGLKANEQEIKINQEKIANLDLAISAGEKFIAAAKKFTELTAEAQAVSATKDEVLGLKNLFIKISQSAVDSKSAELSQVNMDTQTFNLKIIQKSYDVEIKRGIAESPQEGTLQGDKADLNNKLAALQTELQSCLLSAAGD